MVSTKKLKVGQSSNGIKIMLSNLKNTRNNTIKIMLRESKRKSRNTIKPILIKSKNTRSNTIKSMLIKSSRNTIVLVEVNTPIITRQNTSKTSTI